MKELIKEYVDNFDWLIEEGKELKEKYNNEDIRIGVGNYSPSIRTEFYYYNPITGKVKEGAVFMGNGSQHSYKHIGNIEIKVIYGYDVHSIGITRILRPEDENMRYADQYEKNKFPDIEIGEYDNLQHERDKMNSKTGELLVECVNCGSVHVVSQKNVEDGKITPLTYEEDEVICSQCTKQQTIKEFLKKFDNEEGEYEDYLINYCELTYQDNLFL